VHDELVQAMGLTGEPAEVLVQRWPRALPQYVVGHRDRVSQVDAAVSRVPGLFVTGAAYRGAGIAACVEQAERTAQDVLSRLALPQEVSS
jgi:oxygen-dependent protoporphyrinogen oxidase